MENWRTIWAIEDSGNKELGKEMRDYLRKYGMLPTQSKGGGSERSN